MQVELWHVVTAFFAVIAGGWAALLYVHKLFDRLDTKMTDQHDTRVATHEQFKNISEANFAGLRQKDAELALSIATMRLEVAKESQNYVTRAELDRRMERLEDIQGVQNNKLDELLRRLPYNVLGNTHLPPQ